MLKHITVWLEDKPREFLRVARLLGDAKVNIVSHHLVRIGMGGFVQLVCEPHERALSVLKEEYDLFVRESQIIGIQTPDEPGQLERVLGIVGAEERLNVCNSYVAQGPPGTHIILLEFALPEETLRARELLQAHHDLVLIDGLET
jgi:hypothetical protein